MSRPDFTTDELNRRLTTLHPIARRQLARMTDTTYRPANIYRPTLAEQFGELITHPAIVVASKVTAVGMFWFTALMLVAGALMVWGTP